jgi:hypothetical protein
MPPCIVLGGLNAYGATCLTSSRHPPLPFPKDSTTRPPASPLIPILPSVRPCTNPKPMVYWHHHFPLLRERNGMPPGIVPLGGILLSLPPSQAHPSFIAPLLKKRKRRRHTMPPPTLYFIGASSTMTIRHTCRDGLQQER